MRPLSKVASRSYGLAITIGVILVLGVVVLGVVPAATVATVTAQISAGILIPFCNCILLAPLSDGTFARAEGFNRRVFAASRDLRPAPGRGLFGQEEFILVYDSPFHPISSGLVRRAL